MENSEKNTLSKPIRWVALTALAAFILGPGLILIGDDPESADASTEVDGAVEAAYGSPVSPSAGEPIEVAMRGSVSDELDIIDDPTPHQPLSMHEANSEVARMDPGSEGPNTFDCIIEPSERVVVGTAETGVLANFHAERSEFVSAGQILAELESDVERAAVDLAQARAHMSAGVRARKASLNLGSRRRERASELYAGDVLSLDKREEVETEAEVAALELEEAREERHLAKIGLTRAEAELARRTIRSPISGIVVERHKSPGEVVKEEGILTVAQIDPLQVEVILPSGMFGTVNGGMRAEITPEAPAEGNYIAKVDLIDQVIDPASSTFGVRLDLPNPDHSIPSGLHCQVRFIESDE